MRGLVVALFSCAVLSAVLVTNTPSEAWAQAIPGEDVMAQTQSYVGTPYGAGGLDCSGFTSAVYADLGVPLPDGPAAQYSDGVPSEAAAGDLVLFDEAGYGISHVGVATGYGTIIHASTYNGTITETLISQVPVTWARWTLRRMVSCAGLQRKPGGGALAPSLLFGRGTSRTESRAMIAESERVGAEAVGGRPRSVFGCAGP